MRRPIVAYPLAFVLIVLGVLVAIRWSVPGTANGATIVLVLSIVLALVLVARSNVEQPAAEQAEPRRVAVVFQSRAPLATDPGHLGDVCYVTDRLGLVRSTWRHDGRNWGQVGTPGVRR